MPSRGARRKRRLRECGLVDGQLCIETCRGADRENAHQFGRALNSSSSSARPTSCALKARVKGARDGSYGFSGASAPVSIGSSR